MELIGVPVVDGSPGAWPDQIVTDGAGQVWFMGPWQLHRFDPETGDVATWDAEDDRRFAVPSARLAPASGSGVWLLEGARVRLFDGRRFVADVQLPGDLPDPPQRAAG